VNKKKDRVGFIYILVCLVNGKGYVGQTIKPYVKMRWAEHVKAALSGNRRPLYTAMRKYGFHNFVGHVLHVCVESKLNAAEMQFVKRCDTFIDDGWGYNLTTGGNCFRLSRRSIKKIRSSLIRYYSQNPEHRLAIGAQSSARMSDAVVRAHLSKVVSESYDAAKREKMSKLKRRQFASDPSIAQRLSEKATKQWSSKAARKAKSKVSKLGWAVRRKNGTDRYTLEARRNMTCAQLKRFKDPLECKKISDGQLRRYRSSKAHSVSSAAQYRRFAEQPMSAATNAKIAARTKWNWAHNPEFRARILEVLRNRPSDSEKTRAQRSRTLKATWARRKAAA